MADNLARAARRTGEGAWHGAGWEQNMEDFVLSIWTKRDCHLDAAASGAEAREEMVVEGEAPVWASY